MSGEKYIGLDVHQATICAAVMDPMGKVIIESILETKAVSMVAAATTKKAFLCRANSPTTTWLSELAFPLATGTVLTDVIGDDTPP